MDLVTTAARLPQPGETLLGHTFSTVPGGKGGNQAIAAARAGGTVLLIGAVGDDSFGATLTDSLVSSGVSVELLRRSSGSSGIAAITVDQQSENSIVVVPGANSTVTGLTDADRDAIIGASVLLCQLEIPMSAVVIGAGIAAAAAVPVLLNPSPAQQLSAELLACITVLMVNEGEATAIGLAATTAVPHLVITLGAAGARYRGPEIDGHRGEQFDIAAPRVDAIDTTGAGDAFTGAFTVAWTRGLSPREALENACAAGALATTVAGASTSSPGEADIAELVRLTYRR